MNVFCVVILAAEPDSPQIGHSASIAQQTQFPRRSYVIEVPFANVLLTLEPRKASARLSD